MYIILCHIITVCIFMTYFDRMYNTYVYTQELRSLPAVPGPQALPRRRGQKVRIMTDRKFMTFLKHHVHIFVYILYLYYFHLLLVYTHTHVQYYITCIYTCIYRIREAGGFIINHRVMGELAVSRAFGDAEFKKGIQVGTVYTISNVCYTSVCLCTSSV